jgi:chromosome segregation ATPase
MSGADATSALTLAVELERRDSEQAQALDAVAGLERRVEALRERAREFRGLLETLPGELGQLERAEAEARDRRSAAVQLVTEAERRLESSQRDGARKGDEVDAARRDVERERAILAAADAAVHAVTTRREYLLEQERSAFAEIGRLEAEARELARELTASPHVSPAVGTEPETGLEGVLVWAERAHAALLVGRANLERERDRTLREASELASSALGEPVAVASVATIRRRLERELGA